MFDNAGHTASRCFSEQINFCRFLIVCWESTSHKYIVQKQYTWAISEACPNPKPKFREDFYDAQVNNYNRIFLKKTKHFNTAHPPKIILIWYIFAEEWNDSKKIFKRIFIFQMTPLVFLSGQNKQTTAIQSTVVWHQSQCASGSHHWCCLLQTCEKCIRRMFIWDWRDSMDKSCQKHWGSLTCLILRVFLYFKHSEIFCSCCFFPQHPLKPFPIMWPRMPSWSTILQAVIRMIETDRSI